MTIESQRGKSEFDRLYNSSRTRKIKRGNKSIKVSDTKLLSGMVKMQTKHAGYKTAGSTQICKMLQKYLNLQPIIAKLNGGWMYMMIMEQKQR